MRYWKAYIEQELKAKNFPLVEQLFSRCLLSCPNVEIWRLCTCFPQGRVVLTYAHSDVNYVRSVKESALSGRDEVIKAFEFALEHIGLDINSSPLWSEYIAFLKTGEVRHHFVQVDAPEVTCTRSLLQSERSASMR